MIIDARSIETGSRLESHLCIVGAGTAGIVLAREFIGQGLRVHLLESGGSSPDPETQSLGHGENVGLPYYPLDTARARFFGGSSTRWRVPMGGERLGARMRPLDPIDFEKRDWVPFSGWPFDKRHLDSYYQRAQAICRIEPESYAVEDWEDSKARPRLPLPGEEVQTIIYKIGCRDPFVRDYAKEVADAENITTLLHANVLEVETNASADRVTRLRVGTVNGKQFCVTSKVFVLALGGIETPRLLLLSDRAQKTGLGNQNDLVGRFFMEHPHFWSGVFVPNRSDLFQSTALYNDVHMVNGVAIVGKLAVSETVLRREKLLNQNVQLIRDRLPDPFKYRGPRPPGVESFKALCSAVIQTKKVGAPATHLKTIVGDFPSVVAAAARKIRNRVTGTPLIPVFRFANMMEQIPNPESRMTLGKEHDLFGQRRVQLNWKITAQDIRSAGKTLSIIGGALERAGLGRFFPELLDETPPGNTEGGYHHMGTTRMHTDPKQGVVDADCRVHGTGNLFVAGPSVFPTGGYANPVLTIVALAVRLADHLKERVTLNSHDRITLRACTQKDEYRQLACET